LHVSRSIYNSLFNFPFHRGPSALTADHIAKFGVLRKGLDKDDIKELSAEAQEELAVYEDDLDEEEARELFDDGDASKRRKRATTGRDT
jgi:hypothetical protein